ncbi:hypothetical protein RB195_012368 [Necator americanus]|uniref:UPAR/Ly6 domain-containing protein n=1 Tax=Necator americanus TaxID=51031 RepID=A0ABR1D6Q8_NECAM
MSAERVVFVLCCWVSVSAAIKCYLGDQLFHGSLLLRESVALTECPGSRFCVRQELTSADLKTINFFCDQITDIHGNPLVTCKSDGAQTPNTANNFKALVVCCSSDYCNLSVSNSISSSACSIGMILLSVLYKFVF